MGYDDASGTDAFHFQLGGAGKQCFNTKVQNLFTVTSLPVCLTLVCEHTHTSCQPSLADHMVQSGNVFHGWDARHYFFHCEEGLAFQVT